MEQTRTVSCLVDYRPRRQFVPFHRRWQRFACIVTHRRAGKTVACIHDLHRGATRSQKLRPRRLHFSQEYSLPRCSDVQLRLRPGCKSS